VETGPALKHFRRPTSGSRQGMFGGVATASK